MLKSSVPYVQKANIKNSNDFLNKQLKLAIIDCKKFSFQVYPNSHSFHF